MSIAETLLAHKLQLALAGVVVLGGAGATYLIFIDSGNAIDQVPDEADMVVYMDPSVVEAQTTTDLMNGLIDRFEADMNGSYSGPDDYEEMLNNASSDSELDQEKLNSVTMFAKYPDEASPSETPTSSGLSTGTMGAVGGLSDPSYFGVIIDSEWDEETFVDEAENGTDYEKGEYKGYTVYESEATNESDQADWIGVLAAGQFVVGTEDAVKDAIDVNRGEMNPVSGGLRNAYADTRSGDDTYLKFAARFPDQETLDQTSSTTVSDDVYTALEDVTYLSGSYYTMDESEIGIQLRMQTDSQSSADDLAAITDAGLIQSKRNQTSDAVKNLYEQTEVEQDGAVVTVTFESPVEDIADGIEAVLEPWIRLFAGSYGSSPGAGTGATVSETAIQPPPGAVAAAV